MLKTIKDKWVKALLSGRYKQGKGNLAHKSLKGKFEYCCLGVLCHINRIPFDLRGGFKSYNDNSTLLTIGLRDKFGIHRKKMDKLTDMNDGNMSKGIKPHSFKQIVDYIEKNL